MSKREFQKISVVESLIIRIQFQLIFCINVNKSIEFIFENL